MKRLIQTGVSYAGTPLSVRERLAIPASRIEPALRALHAVEGVDECVILSTCNRTELYTAAAEDGPSYGALEQFLVDWCGRGSREEYDEYFRRRAGHRAVLHLFEVAAGLDSMVVGENEVLGQVRRAYSTAVGVGTTGPVLNRLFHMAFEIGKKVRSETRISRSSVSIARLAAEEVLKAIRGGPEACVVVIGAGQTGRQAARILRERGGAVRLRIVNRNRDSAEILASELGAEAAEFARLDEVLSDADAVIAAVEASEPVIRPEHLDLRTADAPPLFIADLAVPRAVDPRVGDLAGRPVRLLDLDDLERVSMEHRRVRESEIAAAMTMVEQQARAFLVWLRQREAASAIAELQVRFEEIRCEELEKHRGRFDPETFGRVDELTRRMVNRMLSVPILQLRELTARDEVDPARPVQFFKDLFKLPGSETGGRSRRSAQPDAPAD